MLMWVMNLGFAGGGAVAPPIVLATTGGIGKRRRKLEALLRERDEAKRRDRDELRGIIEDAVDPPAVAAEARAVLAPARARTEPEPAAAAAVQPLAAPLAFDLLAAMGEAERLAELDDEETLLALLGP